MSKEAPISDTLKRRTRRSYSAQFKAQLVAACLQPGASVAALAREQGINANVLHRWCREHERGLHVLQSDGACAEPVQGHASASIAQPAVSTAVTSTARAGHPTVARALPAFVPLNASHASAPQDIRIECSHHGTQVTVHWPVAAAAECRHWLQSLLRGAPP